VSSNTKYARLLEPGMIGKVKTRNRMIKTGASQLYWFDDETHMNPTTLSFYQGMARGGVGLLIVESPDIDFPIGARWKARYRIDNDKFLPGLIELVDIIHDEGCPTFLQLNHDGPWQNPLGSRPATFVGPPIGASAINLPARLDNHRDVIRPLTISEIKEKVDKFASAAVRAQKAGFDGIDINAASTHLLHNFLSPYWNRRIDNYGGTFEYRTRFLLEVLQEIKRRCGKDFPVMICINGIEVGQAINIPNNRCLTFEDCKKIALMLQDAGADAIHIRSIWLGYHIAGFLTEQLFYPEAPVPLSEFPKEYNYSHKGAGANLILAAGLKKIIEIPIMVVGRFNPEIGEKSLQEGKADFIGIHRRFMADPELPHKLMEDREDEIAPCTACLTCFQPTAEGRRCRIDAFLSTNRPYVIEKAPKKKKVVVVGGGPSGMEAARVAALRGHDVSLYEKTGALGGLMPLASLIKGQEIEDLPSIVRYFKVQLFKRRVKVRTGVEFTPALADVLKPDAIIVATGGALTIPSLKGIDKRIVLTTPALHKKVKLFLRLFGPIVLSKLTKIWLPIGKNVVVIGTGLHGIEIGEFLTKRNRKVTLVDTADVPGEGTIEATFGMLKEWFEKKGVKLINGAKSIEITDTGIQYIDKDEKKVALTADTVIPTRPLTANLDLFNKLKDKASEVYAVGDCVEPKMIVDAIGAGFRTAREI
jgi:2,4-dienoyl-CoA reductase (NADPH2)